MKDERQQVTRSASRLLDLLETVVSAGEINLTSAAAEAGLTPTTALRHLRALEGCGFLHRDDKGSFSAGPTFLRLALTALDDGPNARLIAAAQPYLRELARVTGESAYLAIAEASKAVYIATCESERAIRHVGWVGNSVPLATTAIGAALLGEEGASVRAGSVEPDIGAVAISVRGGDGQVIAALSVIGPTQRMDQSAVEEATAALSRSATALGADLAQRRMASLS